MNGRLLRSELFSKSPLIFCVVLRQSIKRRFRRKLNPPPLLLLLTLLPTPIPPSSSIFLSLSNVEREIFLVPPPSVVKRGKSPPSTQSITPPSPTPWQSVTRPPSLSLSLSPVTLFFLYNFRESGRGREGKSGTS